MLGKFDQTPFSHSKVYKMLEEEPILEYKLILLGDPGVGHSTLLRRFKSFQSDRIECSRLGITTFPLNFMTSKGRVKLNVWSFSRGVRQYGGMRDRYYIGTDCAIIMFDMTARVTYKNTPHWYRDVNRVCENIPVVFVGNKIDSPDKHIKARQVTFPRKRYLEYFEMSAKANYNVIEPFFALIRKLLGDSELEILESPELELPEVEITSELIAKLIEEKYRMDYHTENSDDDF